MATIDLNNAAFEVTHPSAHAHVYQTGHIPILVDFAKAAAKKGSALAAGDIIRLMRAPGKSVVGPSTLEVIVAAAANLTTCTLSVGVEGVDGARFISGFNYKTATVGQMAADAATPTRIIVPLAGDYITLTLTTLTGVLDSGSVNVMPAVLDVADPAKNAGLANRT